MKILTAVLAAVALLGNGCTRSSSGLPVAGSERYRQLCTAFYLGLTALQSGEDVNARKGLTQATNVAPGEPAGWADLGLLQFRQQDYEGAFQSVQKAQALVPQNSRMEALLGVIESRRGHVPEALAHLKKAVALDRGNSKALYSLAQETERQNSSANDADAQRLFEEILVKQPNNLAVLIEVVRLSAKRNDPANLKKAIGSLRKSAPLWPDSARQQLAALEQQCEQPNVRPAAIQAQFLRNVLVRVPAYRQSLDEVKTPVTSAGEPFLKFLKLPSPTSEPSSADISLRFHSQPIAGIERDDLRWIGTFFADDEREAQIMWADARSLHILNGATLELPKGALTEGSRLSRHAILAADLNYDFKTDLVVATKDGLRIFQQGSSQEFRDVTAAAKLRAKVVNGLYTGVWAFDFDLDGDLDIVLGTPAGAPLVLRNNGDGTFAPVEPFRGVDGVTAFASADVDGDGDPDVALLDREGALKVFANERLGDYRLRTTPGEMGKRSLQIAAADMNGDGLPDFVVLKADGIVMRLSDRLAGRDWTCAQIISAKPASTAVLELADLDNNGAIDVVVNNQGYLARDHGYTPLGSPLPAVSGSLRLASSGRVNLVGLTGEGRPVELVNSGAKQYGWQDVRPKAAATKGDQRINSFGIGGEIEIRSGLLTQKQIILSPVLHFGLGDHKAAEFARIVWPNGLIQTEFSPTPNQALLAGQRLKGSCPLLFAWNGNSMQFVKDVAPMSGALGAHNGAGQFARIEQTEEWFKVPGNQLQARQGLLDLRITDEYWETYYIDHYGLTAIDHPAGTEVFADERVAVPPAPLKTYVTGSLHSFTTARDERGQSVASAIEKLDGQYLNTFSLGSYQGVARDHWVELELPADAPRQGPLYLVAQGWLHPWDDNILVAVNQGKQTKPRDLSLEVMARDGRWKTVHRNLGVPAGREKTVMLDLAGVFVPGAPRRLRLRTNLEIYWDRLQWATGLPGSMLREEKLTLATAKLEHRGFSQIEQATPRAPETPNYNILSSTGNRWQAIEGYYTRFGDVRSLLAPGDGRFVIAGSGDELRLQFATGTRPPTGWVRDYLLVADGWMKEGDYNFKYSTTVLPLPDHAMKVYKGAAEPLEADPVYHQHKDDWQTFHTRYVSAESFSAQSWK